MDVQPASEKDPRPRHESPAAHSLSDEQPSPAAISEALQAIPDPSAHMLATASALNTRRMLFFFVFARWESNVKRTDFECSILVTIPFIFRSRKMPS
jgi:hypothetical protein